MTEPTSTPSSARTRPSKSKRGEVGVKPSAPDSVETWLDMLVSMLALPKPERERVRDELEDHLRSRIDDLLITGLTEPEALHKAASELGETADLARQLTRAHGPKRKRTYAMHAALFALAGSIAAVGIMTISPTTGTRQSPNAAIVVSDKPAAEQHAAAGNHAENPTAQIDFQDLPFPEAFRVVAESFGKSPGLSATMLRRYREHETKSSMTGTFTLDEAMNRLLSYDPYGNQSKAYYVDNDVVVITDPMVVIRRSIRTATYEMDWIESYEHGDIMVATRMAIENSPASQFSQVSIAAGSMLITARPEAHVLAERILLDLRNNYESRRRAELATEAKAAEAIEVEYASLLERKFELNYQLDVLGHQSLGSHGRRNDLPEDEREAFDTDMRELNSKVDRLRYELKEVVERLAHIRAHLIKTEYAPILNRLPTRSTTE